MSIVKALRRAADHAIEMAAGLAAAERVARRLESARPLPAPDVSPGTAGGVAPSAGAPPVSSGQAQSSAARSGAAVGSSAGGGGGSGGGVLGVQTNASKLREIVAAAGVAAPARGEWSPAGLPEAAPGTIVATVMSLGAQAPVSYLRWVAGLLAYAGASRAGMGAGGAGSAGGGVSAGAAVPVSMLRGQSVNVPGDAIGAGGPATVELQTVARASAATADGVAQLVAEMRALRADLARPDIRARAGRG